MLKFKTLLAAIGAVVVLSVAVSTASALRSIEVRPGGNVTASGILAFGPELEPGQPEMLDTGLQIRCAVTLLRTVARAISKREGTVFGKITGVAIRDRRQECGNGIDIEEVNRVIALRNAGLSECRDMTTSITLCVTTGGEPRLWNLVYRSFLGTLPRITGIRFEVERVQFLIDFRASGVPLGCLYEGNVPALLEIRDGRVGDGTILLTETRLRRIGNNLRFPFIGCPAIGRLSGTFAIAPAQTIALI